MKLTILIESDIPELETTFGEAVLEALRKSLGCSVPAPTGDVQLEEGGSLKLDARPPARSVAGVKAWDEEQRLQRVVREALVDPPFVADPDQLPQDFGVIQVTPCTDPDGVVTDLATGQQFPVKGGVIDPNAEINPFKCELCGFVAINQRGHSVHMSLRHKQRGKYFKYHQTQAQKNRGSPPAEAPDPTGSVEMDEATNAQLAATAPVEQTPDRKPGLPPEQWEEWPIRPQKSTNLDPRWQDSPYSCKGCRLGFFLTENLENHQKEFHKIKFFA